LTNGTSVTEQCIQRQDNFRPGAMLHEAATSVLPAGRRAGLVREIRLNQFNQNSIK